MDYMSVVDAEAAASLESNSFEYVVLGTGLVESITAAALSRCGHSVLHIDRNDYYGGQLATLNLNDLHKWAECQQNLKNERTSEQPANGNDVTLFPLSQNDHLASHVAVTMGQGNNNAVSVGLDEQSISGSACDAMREEEQARIVTCRPTAGDTANAVLSSPALVNSSDNQNVSEPSPANQKPQEPLTTNEDVSERQPSNQALPGSVLQSDLDSFPTTDASKASQGQSEKDDAMGESSEAEALLLNSRHYNIDLFPQLLWANGSMVQLLVTSGVSRYLEFRALQAVLLLTEEGLKKVPCHKGDVFVSKELTVVEKRILMKFLTLCKHCNERPETWQEQRSASFSSFMAQHGLSLKSQQYVAYAIALAQRDVIGQEDTMTVEEGVQRTNSFLSSLGVYGHTPFLTPIYGTSELSQAFCRLCAVYGGEYMLRQSPLALTVTQDEASALHCKGVLLRGGVHVNVTKAVVTGPSYLMLAGAGASREVTRGIFVTDRGLSGATETGANAQCTVFVIPPNICGTPAAITAIQLCSAEQVCPQGKHIVHMTCQACHSTPQEDLIGAQQLLFDHGEATQPRVLCSAYARLAVPANDVTGLPANVHLVNVCESCVSADIAVDEAKNLFERLCPGEEWFPPQPDPEDLHGDVVSPNEGSPCGSPVQEASTGFMSHEKDINEADNANNEMKCFGEEQENDLQGMGTEGKNVATARKEIGMGMNCETEKREMVLDNVKGNAIDEKKQELENH